MIEYRMNVPGLDGSMLDGLNRTYDPWGSQEIWDWSVGLGADRIAGFVDGELAYGACLYHRRVRVGERTVKAAIIGAGWTLPEFRRMGLSTGGLDLGKRYAAERGLSFFLSFVVNTRVSYRNMVDNDLEMVPSRYFKMEGSGGIRPYDLSEVEVTEELLRRVRSMDVVAGNGFDYDEREWTHQFIERVPRSTVLSIEGRGFALVSDREEQDAVLSIVQDGTLDLGRVISSLMDRSHGNGNGLFYYSTDRSEWEVLSGMSDEVIEGSVAVTSLDGRGGGGEWSIRNGDRM